MRFPYRVTAIVAAAATLLSGCLSSGGDDAGAGSGARGTTTYTIGGNVSGLTGTGLVLRNGVDNLGVGASGSFTFTTPISAGSTYSVSVFAQPTSPSQTCSVTNAAGTAATGNVTSVAVNCVTNTFTVTATVLGVSGTGLVLQNNLGDNLNVDTAGAFTFATPVASGAAYSVTVLSQPSVPTQTCTPSGGSGTVGGGNVTTVVVACSTNKYTVGGNVGGLLGTGLVLRNNGGDNLAVVAPGGGITFSKTVASGLGYDVSVFTQPAGQNCAVANGSGIVGSANVSNVAVSCVLTPPTLSVAPLDVKKLRFSWTANSLATHYRLFENPDGIVGFTQLGPDLTAASFDLDLSGTLLTRRMNASYIVAACKDTSCTDSSTLQLGSSLALAIGYLKASNTGGSDFFGWSLALSADGSTLAVGAHEEDSSATGINGNQADNSAANSGAVYVFTRDLTVWSQQAYLKPSNTQSFSGFGYALALSADGNTLAVGAPGESSAATGINGNENYTCSPSLSTNCALWSGAVYVFARSAGAWIQQAYVKPSSVASNGTITTNSLPIINSKLFGGAVGLSTDGNTLAVGAPNEGSAQTGINGTQAYECFPATTNCAAQSGAVYVFTRSVATWSQQAYVKASNTGASDFFGRTLTLSGDGSTLAVAAPGEDSAARGVNLDQVDDCANLTPTNCAANSGAVYVFTRNLAVWSQQAYVKASNADAGDDFGGFPTNSVFATTVGIPASIVGGIALSVDGNTLAVGAVSEASAAQGINGNQADNSLKSGAVYVFTRSGAIWSQQAYVKASNTGSNDNFGASVAFSSDGNLLAVGAPAEASAATGINGNQVDNSISTAGAVYLFTRSGSVWVQHAYVKASNTGVGDRLGRAVALSGDGTTLAAGAPVEASGAAGIGVDQTDNSSTGAGAVYLY